MIREFVLSVLTAVFPFACHVCGRKTGWGEILCSSCSQAVREGIAHPATTCDLIDGVAVFWFGLYESVLASTIKAAKYRPSRKLVQWLATEACGVAHHVAPEGIPDIFIPVPLHPNREQRRGFNQAEVAARIWADGLGRKFSPVLQRQRATRPQAECDEHDRAANLTGAFALAPALLASAFRGRHLCLVDDVATTGATLGECAAVLRLLEPCQVSAWVFAHSPRRFPVAEG